MIYTIKEGQTALDVVNQLYGNQDNIGTLYSNNEDFDINLMQNNLEIFYEMQNSQLINEIQNNNYLFVNRDNVVYELLASLQLIPGNYNFYDLYPSYVGKSYYEIINTGEKKFITNSSVTRIYDNSVVNIYYELF